MSSDSRSSICAFQTVPRPRARRASPYLPSADDFAATAAGSPASRDSSASLSPDAGEGPARSPICSTVILSGAASGTGGGVTIGICASSLMGASGGLTGGVFPEIKIDSEHGSEHGSLGAPLEVVGEGPTGASFGSAPPTEGGALFDLCSGA